MLELFNFFLIRYKKKNNYADIAKNRLNIIFMEHKYFGKRYYNYFTQLKYDVLDVIDKYVYIKSEIFSVKPQKEDNQYIKLELIVTFKDIKNQ